VVAKLNAKQMDVFVAVMTHGSITAAAQHLNVSQPAVSRMIERFELAAGFVAFERRRGKLFPTPESEIFFAEVRQVYRGIEYLQEVAREIGGTGRGSLRVGVFPAFAEGWIGQRLARYLVGRERLFASVTPMPTDSIVDAVSRQTIDFGIAMRASDREDLCCEQIWRSEIVCILPNGHRLREKRSITPADLSGEPFVSMADRGRVRSSIDTIFATKGIERDIRAESPWASSVCHLVSRGVGVALVIRDSAEEFAHLGYHIAAFKPSVDYAAYVISSTARPMPTAAKGFRDMLLMDYSKTTKTTP